MEIYIEDIILDNFIINFVLLFLTAKILNIKYKKLLLILSASIGVCFTFLNLIINLSTIMLFAYKFLIALTMLLIAFNFKSFKQFMLRFFTFLLTTALMGGFCFLICFSFGDIELINGIVYYKIFLPMGVIVGLVFILAILIIKIIEVIKLKSYNSNFIYNITLCENQKIINSTAFLDTGNTLVDPLTGKPVNIITYKLFQKIFKEVPLHQIILKRIPSGLKNAHYIKVNSVANKSEMLVFCVDELKISQNKYSLLLKDSCLGLTLIDLEKKLSCGFILNPGILIN